VSAPDVRLRPAAEGEQMPDERSSWDDWGERDGSPPADLQRMVVEADGEVVGSVSWHTVRYGPNRGSRAVNIGIGLAERARGRGIGTRAQRMLVEHLFRTTDVHRVEAGTDVDNVAEQRSLDKAGFTREGVLRSAQMRADGRHDIVSYSFLRTDLPPPPADHERHTADMP
jgi:RimJ/RimL family protein N-acetyltransferase